ncbi:MAG: SusC/RagA family TonB-linked outer membrane protein, partial [Bacteroidetes bacterium]
MLKVLAVVAGMLPVMLYGQRTLTGTVTDASNGEPLIGANILAVGTSTGTITDIDGSFTLEVPDGVTTLQVSYTGYRTLEVPIGASNTIDIQLEPGSILNEIVVIGYGTVKREDATGSVQTVDSEVFNRGAITGAQELLSGKVAGVQIVTSGDPGGGAAIRIRGGSSLSASNDPLIVVDGVPVDNGGISGERNILNFINPNDIESFTVLKDASATAIYGSRASNGVILITTKKGHLGKAISVNYSGNYSISSPIKTVDVLNAAEYRALIEERYPEGHPARDLLGNADTDWQDVIYEDASGHDHSLSISGGIGSIPYRVSLGYTDKNGILKTDNFKRTTAALNLSPGFLDNRLQINFNVKGMNTDNVFANRGAIGAALFFDPTHPVYDEGNPYGGYFTWTQQNGDPNPLAAANPLALIEMRDDQSNVKRLLLNGSIDYRLESLPELRFNLNMGYDYSKGEGTVNVPGNASFAYDAQTGGGVKNEYSQEKKNELLEFYMNYVKEFDDLKLDAMAGYSWQRFFFSDNFINSDIAGIDVTEGDSKGELFL